MPESHLTREELKAFLEMARRAPIRFVDLTPGLMKAATTIEDLAAAGGTLVIPPPADVDDVVF